MTDQTPAKKPNFEVAKVTNKTYCISQADYWIKYTGLPSYSILYEAYTDGIIKNVEVLIKDRRIQELKAKLEASKANSDRYTYLRDVLKRKDFRADVGLLSGSEAIAAILQKADRVPIDVIRIELPMFHVTTLCCEGYVWNADESFNFGKNMDLAIDHQLKQCPPLKTGA